jgi:hypothetical protein
MRLFSLSENDDNHDDNKEKVDMVMTRLAVEMLKLLEYRMDNFELLL